MTQPESGPEAERDALVLQRAFCGYSFVCEA